MKIFHWFVVFFVSLICTMRADAQLREQTVFGTDDTPVERPVTVPEAIVNVLAQDPDVSKELQSHHLGPGQIPDEWLTASQVHLKKTSTALVVIARSFLAGANVTTFWVFDSGRENKARLLLKIPAQTLTIRPPRVRDYLSIEAAAIIGGKAAKREYRFDGNRYSLAK